MRRNLNTVVLVPCVLSLILVVLIILDKNDVSLIPVKGKGSKQTAVSVTPTPSTQPTQLPQIIDEPTPEPTPTDTPAQSPTIPATPTPAPTTVPTPTLAPTLTTEPVPEPSGVPENGGKPVEVTYNAIYRQDGDNYSLIADGDTLTYLILNKQDNSVRQTGYPFQSLFAEFPGEQLGPIIGSKNDHFVFVSDNRIVASDGTQEEVLVALDNMTNINSIVNSENRVLAAFGQCLCIVDLRDFSVETYYENYTPGYFALTDDYFSFSKRRRIPAGPYYEFLYTARDGKVNLLAMIGEIYEYNVDTENNIVNIKAASYDYETYQLDLKTDKLSTTKTISKHRTLYLPAYGDGIIENLTDIRYINRNSNDEQVVLKVLPTSFKADVYYNSYYDTYYFTFYLPEKEHLLPGSAGGFTVIDYSVVSLIENKFLRDSSVKELLFTGQTSIGNAEIYLLERYERMNDESITFEIVYAWIPIKDSTEAYQLYLYVPRGESHKPYLDLVKQLIS